VRRFRPNIVIDTNSGDEGLVEQDWIGKQMLITDSLIDCTATAPRCGAITRAQEGLEFDKSMLRTIVKDADQNLGIYGSIQQAGVLSVGDAVYINYSLCLLLINMLRKFPQRLNARRVNFSSKRVLFEKLCHN